MDSQNATAADRSRTIYLLVQAGRGIARELDKAFSSLPVTPMQYTVLSILNEREPLSNAELSRWFFVTAQTMNEAVSALVKADYLTRTEDARNRRILRVGLSSAGRAVLRKCDRIVERVEAELFSDMAREDVKDLRGLLRIVLKHVRDQRGGREPE